MAATTANGLYLLEDINDANELENQEHDEYDTNDADDAAARRQLVEARRELLQFLVTERLRAGQCIFGVHTETPELRGDFLSRQHGFDTIERLASVELLKVSLSVDYARTGRNRQRGYAEKT